MLNFTTTNIVNTAGTFGAYQKDGSAATAIANAAKFRLDFGPEFEKDSNNGGISAIYVNKASVAELAQATVDLSLANDTSATYRINVYIRISDSNESTYANSWVYKGKPLSLGEFVGGSTAAEVAALVKKHQLALYGSDLLSVVATNATTLTITAKTQFQRFINQDGNLGVELQKYTANGTSVSVYGDGEFVTVPGGATITVAGKEAFGDFAHITKDLRLPSDANTRWYGIANGDVMSGDANDDRPNPGVYYSQITVVYDHNRGLGNQSIAGGLGRSRTVHVFYVADSTPANGVDADGANVAGLAATFVTELRKVTAVVPENQVSTTSVI